MTAVPPPLSVAIIGGTPVVFLGVAARLRPFSHRVRIKHCAGPLPQPGRVDVVLYDPFVPSNTIGRLREIGIQTGAPVVALSSVMDAAQIDEAMTAGAAGFLTNAMDGAAMVTALEAFASGTTEPAADRELPATTAWLGQSDGLRSREAAIVSLIVVGMTNQEIASALYLSMTDVKTHIRSAYPKMGVTSRTSTILWGVNRGFQRTAPASRLNDGGQR